MSDDGASLPPQVRADLAGGNDFRVGEWLRETVERIARTGGDAERVLRPVAAVARGRPLLLGYLDWVRGIAAHLDGDAAAASTRLETAMQTFAAEDRRDLGDRVGLLLVDVRGSARDLTGARRLADRLERSFRARGDTARAALSVAALAGAEDASDRVARAGKLWREALRELNGNNFRGQMVRANLANVALLEGRHRAAMNGHRKIAEVAAGMGLVRLVLQAETNLAEAEFAAGRIDQALRRWHDVIDRSDGSGLTLEASTARLELAAAEVALGDLGAAAVNLQGLGEYFERNGLDPEWSRVLRLEGLIEAGKDPQKWRGFHRRLLDAGDAASAGFFLVDVASTVGAVGADELTRATASLRGLGFEARAWLAQSLAARDEALAGRMDRARDLARAVVGARRASSWARMMARYALAKAEPQAAGRHLAAAIRIADNLLGRLNSAADRSAFFSLRRDLYLEAIARLIERGRRRDTERALDLVHRFSSGWLMDELTRREARGDDPNVARWVELRRRLATLLEEMEGESEPRLRRSGLKIRDRLRDLESEIGSVERTLARRWSGSLPVEGGHHVGSRLASRLPRGHRVLELLPDGRDVLLFNADRDGLEARRMRGIGPDLRRLVASARFHLDARPWLANGRGEQMDRAFASTLAKLSGLLFDGIDLDGVHTLWVAPHGVLYGLPWAGLTAADGSWLIDRLTVTVVPGSAVAGRLLEVAMDRPTRIGLAGVEVDALPEVAGEIRDIRRLFPDAECATNSDRTGFAEMLKTCEAVHLAGHAVFLDGLPAASGLRMRDGFITVHDLAASRINAGFVSFGVCSGTRITHSDPVRSEGFLRALIAGGVRTVVGSVAPVRDDVARAFSTALYRSLSTHWAPGEAWREAVAEVRATFSAPALWSAFQIFGDPRPAPSVYGE